LGNFMRATAVRNEGNLPLELFKAETDPKRKGFGGTGGRREKNEDGAESPCLRVKKNRDIAIPEEGEDLLSRFPSRSKTSEGTILGLKT